MILVGECEGMDGGVGWIILHNSHKASVAINTLDGVCVDLGVVFAVGHTGKSLLASCGVHELIVGEFETVSSNRITGSWRPGCKLEIRATGLASVVISIENTVGNTH